ncbi:hypothetical protein [Robertmurraya sp.]|uniref:hypothetical protein n=1 Tax=Robertmurraya sp. TaxID=2837525 RepID=UPI003703BF8A
MTTQHSPLQHTSLSAAMATVQNLANQGHTSMKVWRELGLWYIIVNGEMNNGK